MNRNNTDNIKQSLEIDKLKLEIDKAKNDIKHSNRTFFAQVLNTIVLGSVGLAALYYFQRPQVLELEASRMETERSHIASLLIEAQRIGNERDKSVVIHVMAVTWPQFAFLKEIDESIQKNLSVTHALETEKQLAENASEPGKQGLPPEEVSKQCAQTALHIAELFKTEDKLRSYAAVEEAVGGQARPPGRGPVWAAYMAQIRDTEAILKATIQARASLGCPDH